MPKPKPRVAPLPLSPIAGKKAELAKLRKLLFLNWLSPFLRKHIKYVPRTSHTNTLGTFEHFAQQGPTAKTITLVVGDDSGSYELSETAGRHWLEVALAGLAEQRTDFAPWIGSFGFELATGSLAELLRARDRPLVEVMHAGKPWLVAAVRGKPTTVICDVDIGPPSFAALDATGKRTVAAAAKTGVCACFLCASLRAKRTKPKPKTKPKAKARR